MIENFERLDIKGVYEKFDFAEFLKNNNKYEESIRHYSEVLKSINNDHPIFCRSLQTEGVLLTKD